MNLKNAFYFIVSLLLTGGIALAQQAAPAPPSASPRRPRCWAPRANLQTLSRFSLKAAAFSASMPKT